MTDKDSPHFSSLEACVPWLAETLWGWDELEVQIRDFDPFHNPADSERLEDALVARGYKVQTIREPGGVLVLIYPPEAKRIPYIAVNTDRGLALVPAAARALGATVGEITDG